MSLAQRAALAEQHQRDSAEIDRLNARVDQLEAEKADLLAQLPSPRDPS